MKYIIEVDAAGILLNAGISTGMGLDLPSLEKYEGQNQKDVTLQLVKQGVTVDEIIKLKNADLL